MNLSGPSGHLPLKGGALMETLSRKGGGIPHPIVFIKDSARSGVLIRAKEDLISIPPPAHLGRHLPFPRHPKNTSLWRWIFGWWNAYMRAQRVGAREALKERRDEGIAPYEGKRDVEDAVPYEGTLIIYLFTYIRVCARRGVKKMCRWHIFSLRPQEPCSEEGTEREKTSLPRARSSKAR